MSADLKPAFLRLSLKELGTWGLQTKHISRSMVLVLTTLAIACAPLSNPTKPTVGPRSSVTAGPTAPDSGTFTLPTVDPPAIPGHDIPGIKPTFEREDLDVKILFFLPYGQTQPNEGTLVYTFKPNTQRAYYPSYDELRKDLFLFKMNIDPRLTPGVRIMGGMGFANELQTRLVWDSFINSVDFKRSNTFRLIWEKDWKLKGSTWNGVPLPVKQPNSN